MKSKLLKATLALMTTVWVGGVQAQDAPNFGTEEVVSEETTWVFNDYETGDKTEFSQTDKLYLRAYVKENSYDYHFTISATDKKLLSFSDGYTVEVEQAAVSSNGTDFNNGVTTANSTIEGKLMKNTAMFAFNTNVAGTVYVIMKEHGDHNNSFRGKIWHWNGTSASELTNGGKNISDGSSFEVSYEVAAGSVFVGSTSNACEIYAIRFVPTATKADKIVYIGATGYATYAATDDKSYSTPEGLSAFGAKASADGHAVELIQATNMKRQTGYILKGTPNTNYKLTVTSDPATPSGNQLKRNNGDKTFSGLDANGKDDSNNYYYILAADNGVAKFFAVANGTTLANGKAWLQTTTQLTPAVGARGVDIIIGDETTGIETVQSSKLKVQGYYNLAGQRVAQPAKGLYIVNGKKIMIK